LAARRGKKNWRKTMNFCKAREKLSRSMKIPKNALGRKLMSINGLRNWKTDDLAKI